jgi:hypothetical protein
MFERAMMNGGFVRRQDRAAINRARIRTSL